MSLLDPGTPLAFASFHFYVPGHVKGVRARLCPALRTRLPLKSWKKNKKELVTLLTEESLMGLQVNLGSVYHSLAYWDRRFGGGREEMNLFREHDICGAQR